MTERWKILQGDCLPIMRDLPDASVHAVVTDPPYGLSEHAPAEVLACLSAWCRGEEYQPAGRGFMGKAWDAWVPGPAYWREALRVLKPGGHLLAFAGSRTQDLMGMALRLAGFEIRDCIMWVFGSGFPKSLDVSKAIDAAAGAEREVVGTKLGRPGMAKDGGNQRSGFDSAFGGNASGAMSTDITAPATPEAAQWAGWGTALKPAYEPIIVARKPLGLTVAACVLEHGTGGLNIDGCRVPGEKPDTIRGAGGQNGRYGPLGAQGAILDDGRGRWPANLAHDGSPEVLALFPETSSGAYLAEHADGGKDAGCLGAFAGSTRQRRDFNGDSGSAARFFYAAKASKEDRDEGLTSLPVATAGERAGGRAEGSAGLDNPRAGTSSPGRNAHPTVKPTDLMRWLVRLVTPPGGVVLDPFCGSGSTGKAAMLEGFRFIGIEREEASAETARLRVAHAEATPVQLDIFATPIERAAAEPHQADTRQLDMFGGPQ